MPRPPRIEIPGLTYHVWANGVSGLPIFRSAEDKDVALRLLREEVAINEWTCIQYVVMTTHYHLVVKLEKPTLSRGFQRLNTRYAQYFNKQNTRRGHVFESRFNAKIVPAGFDELEVARYVALNPTRAQMCRLPEQYPWSAYGAIIGLYPPDPIVDLGAALAPVGGSRAAYRKFVEELDPRVRRGQTRVRPLKKKLPRAA